ncbi:hypothetical protein EMIHUDRAFT_114111 [Emiliania huxleyi CCMP1516]|uniref:RRM domain-containing protein n=3 Tax=Emiliania huxleyi TaxID=2903 RepID=A0A0D3I2A3_EMIH1|nr:hypothetical protein EMIHUDRAFT_97282 [Emiliania huxleyi CCMP1516]XP_005781146.1 hypothetical protein EMIHUDRAFT_114111 [Emiliania huxleyi CCMP1516]EOD05388.1 hypothetical protein EMIHUDRAFT_97282 [Emiliania huxleyi CCMP1516]EOD28717.1 hypothetical protein EMIHUDRAFT_114111 [Emiliania huxleyi CCMP1516]|eukprot:XP_005757817.1 hypothetical protein EMIHUDRAFT_97282 [Emiliania huxleyi CCMP1516]
MSPPRFLGAPSLPPAPAAEPAPAPAAEPTTGVFIGNLPAAATAELLTELLVQAGPLVGEARLPKDLSGEGHRGIGFADYADEASALYAIALFDGLRFGDRALRVNPSGERPQRGAAPKPPHPVLAALRDLACHPAAWNGDHPREGMSMTPEGSWHRSEVTAGRYDSGRRESHEERHAERPADRYGGGGRHDGRPAREADLERDYESRRRGRYDDRHSDRHAELYGGRFEYDRERGGEGRRRSQSRDRDRRRRSRSRGRSDSPRSPRRPRRAFRE